MRGTLKRASVVRHPQSEPQKKIALDREQDLTPHPSVSHGGSSASGAQPSITTSTDQNTGTSDVTSEVRTGPTKDSTRASSKDRIGGDGAMGEDNADENSAGHPSPSGSDNRRRITTKREPREVRDEQSSTTEQHVPRRIFGKATPQEHAVAVTTQEAVDGYREKTMRIANVENNTLNWVSISSARALDMTHCNFSVRSARDEMRHIIGSSEPDVISGSDKDHNRECRKKDKDMEFLCELYEAQAARGRHFVHELTSEVNSRMQYVAKIMAMPGLRTTVADLCMFGLAACGEGGPGFVNSSVRTITNARQVGMRMRSKCTDTHRHARVDASNTIEKGAQTRTWVRQIGRAVEEQLREDDEGLETHEQKKKTEDAKRIRGIVHDNNKNKRTSHVQDEMVKLMHHDEQELVSLWEGWHWDDKKGGQLDPELCDKATREKNGVLSSPQDVHESPRRGVPTRNGEGIKTGWAETDKDQPRKPNVCARWVEGIQDARKARVVRVDAAAGGVESSAVGDRHG